MMHSYQLIDSFEIKKNRFGKTVTSLLRGRGGRAGGRMEKFLYFFFKHLTSCTLGVVFVVFGPIASFFLAKYSHST